MNLPYNGSIRVGRHPDNDIVVSYPIISGHHFQLQLEAGQVHVQDQNSTNGLYLNGKRISKAIMKSGDVLSIYTFHFYPAKWNAVF
ncbi:MAG: FHA domain-containing protein [Lachnospiraceae bacterium]